MENTNNSIEEMKIQISKLDPALIQMIEQDYVERMKREENIKHDAEREAKIKRERK